MKAVIFASGYGTRLGTLTNKVPKPMLKVGKPVLERLIDRLNLHGITEIIITTHYLPLVITEGIKSRALYFYEDELLSQEDKLRTLSKWLTEDFLVINGDTLTDLNYTDMISFHKKGTITAAMDGWTCIGTWIYPPNFTQATTRPYRPTRWTDIGSKDKLKEERAKYN